ncbi:MAG: class I SAM-dependent methyltransferase [Christensenellaceae bacterium]|nr:class I SAM-dependent methyltransferase [Christensenellaceae bacterium]
MLDSKGFDLWADNYDISVEISDDDGAYPFAGYKKVLNYIFGEIMAGSGKTLLDIGFGTGILTKRLYDKGFAIYGQDFSGEMLNIAKDKMPEAKLFQGDFTLGLVSELKQRQYDAIIATYSLHHIVDEEKPAFIKELMQLLNEHGKIYIGDVAFSTRKEMEKCKETYQEEWDDEEHYFVVEELKGNFPSLSFIPFSHCAGVIVLEHG